MDIFWVDPRLWLGAMVFVVIALALGLDLLGYWGASETPPWREDEIDTDEIPEVAL